MSERSRSLTDSEQERLLAQAAAIRRGVAGFAGRLRLERGGALSFNQSAVLALLFRFGDLTPGELASQLGRSPQSLTRVLQGLETERLVQRRDDPADRRQSLLALTLEGREALGAQMRPRDRWLAGVLAEQLTSAECELLVVAAGLLERLTDVPVARSPRGSREAQR